MAKTQQKMIDILCLLLPMPFFLSLWVGDFAQPLVGISDIESNEHLGFFLGKLLNFSGPFLLADFQTDWVGYPYGTMTALQGWFFERELIMVLAHRFMGAGPWVKFYLVASYLITAVGSYLLLSGRFSRFSSFIVAFAVTYLNFYAYHRYPGALATVCFHWLVLSLITDFLISEKVATKKRLALEWLLWRGLLLLLSLGLELGYVAGLSLSSFTLTSIFVLIYLIKERKFTWKIVEWPLSRLRKRRCFVLALFSLVPLYLYVPLCVQLSHIFSAVPDLGGGSFWSNPMRLFFPWFPMGWNPAYLGPFLKDSSEGLGPLSVGWTFLLPAILGTFVLVREKKTYYLPTVILLTLCLMYHPKLIPTLKIFPWFQHMRVSGRISILLPTLMGLIALAWFEYRSRPFQQRWVVGIIALLALIEGYTAYFSFKRTLNTFEPNSSFNYYMSHIRALPGQAVLDWPFCIHGGNGYPEGMCPGGVRNEAIFALQRFHGKKVPGYYIGRLTPGIVAPFREAGWQFLLNDTDTCFSQAQWDFFTKFYLKHDFVGINLYVDLIPAHCRKGFENRFGESTLASTVPGAGKVLFIPKSQKQNAQLREPHYQPRWVQPAINLAHHQKDVVETWGLEKGRAMALLARKQNVGFRYPLESSRRIGLDFVVSSFHSKQELGVLLNGSLVYRSGVAVQPKRVKLTLPSQSGWNRVEFRFKKSGAWQDVFALYREKNSLFAFLKVLKLQKFYNQHRHLPATFKRLVLFKTIQIDQQTLTRDSEDRFNMSLNLVSEIQKSSQGNDGMD